MKIVLEEKKFLHFFAKSLRNLRKKSADGCEFLHNSSDSRKFVHIFLSFFFKLLRWSTKSKRDFVIWKMSVNIFAKCMLVFVAFLRNFELFAKIIYKCIFYARVCEMDVNFFFKSAKIL